MRTLIAALGLAAVACCATLLLAQPAGDEQQPADSSGPDRQVERGRYLVHHVAQCVQCHTPRTERGELIERRLLRGAPVPVPAPYPNMAWAFEAPPLAGLPGWTEREITTLLRTGRRPSGEAPRRPMPTYQMTEEDAAAVAAYLKSLGR